MHEDAELIQLAQNVARQGGAPHQIINLLLANVQPKWQGHIPILTIEACLIQAFKIPLREVREIERWIGFTDRGDWSDADLDSSITPWIRRYLQEDIDKRQT